MELGAPLAAGELIDALCNALAWPTTRPARLVAGERAALVQEAALCVNDAAIDEVGVGVRAAFVLATPPSPAVARRGRRSYDVFEDDTPGAANWQQAVSPIIDASEQLAGGAGGFDELLLAAVLGDDAFASATPLAAVERGGFKLVGFVPADSLEAVRTAIFAAGAGVIGQYIECSWSTTGTGTFRGGPGSNQVVGTAGTFEQVEEVRLETVIPAGRRDEICRAFVAAHPYEMPAFDVHELRTPAAVGPGRFATVPDLAAFATELGQAVGAIDTQGELPARGGRVALTTGSLGAVLTHVLRTDNLAAVVCSEATVAERALLAERDIMLLVVDRAGVVKAFGEALAARLSRAIRLKVQLVAPLQFPNMEEVVPQQSPLEGGAAASPAQPSPANGAWKMYFDGGSRGNPGPAAAAFVIYGPDGAESAREGRVLGSTTNNVAEYQGLIAGLQRALELGATDLQIFGDSELIVKQVLGQYKVKNEAMKPLHAEAAALLKQLDHFTVRHVYRTDNAVADALVNEALDLNA